MITGIYIIQNIVNNKIYVGSAVDIKKRWRDHKWHLKENKHHNPHLQSSYNKYGKQNFKFSIELECDINELLETEKTFIIKYNTKNRDYGYNLNDPENVFLGRKHSEETKKLLSEKKIGENNPMFGKTGNTHHNFGKILSNNIKEKISKNRKGIVAHYGENCPNSKLKESDILLIREKHKKEKISHQKLAKLFNISKSQITKIINRKSWSHI